MAWLAVVAVTLLCAPGNAHEAVGHPSKPGRESKSSSKGAPKDKACESEPCTIEVKGERPAAPLTASTTFLSQRDFELIPRRSAEDVLRLVPGLTLVQHGSEGKSQQIFLRGFDAMHGQDFALTVDGIPVNEWSNVHSQGYIDLGFVIPEVVESIEVVKGPFTIDEGAFAVAGSAKYRLGVAEADRGLHMALTLGTTERRRAMVSYSKERGQGDSFIALEGLSDAGFGTNRAVERGNLLAKVVVFDSEAHGKLTILGSSYAARFGLPGALRNADIEAGEVGFYDSYDLTSRGQSERALLGASYSKAKGDQSLELSIYGGYRRLDLLENFTGFLLDPVGGDRRNQRQSSALFGGEVKLGTRLVHGLTLDTGLAARADSIDQEQIQVGEGLEFRSRDRSLTALQVLPSARVALNYQLRNSLKVHVGVRADLAAISVTDRLDDNAESGGAVLALSPRAALEWQPVNTVRIFASYGRGFRPPEARAFTSFRPDGTGIDTELYRGGSPEMTNVDSTEVGARLSPNRHVGLQMAAFASFMERESIYDHVSGINLELNSTRRLGGEVSVRFRPVEFLTLQGDVTAVDARFTASQSLVPFVPPVTGGLRALFEYEKWRAGARFSGFLSRPLPHGARGAPYGVVDLTLGYQFQRLDVGLEVENLFDLKLREGEYHFASDFRTGSSSSLPVLHSVAGAPFNARLTLSGTF
jgi:iron complex outermembrane recepter protein